MNAVAAGIGHVAVRVDLEHKSSSVPSGAHITPGTGHKVSLHDDRTFESYCCIRPLIQANPSFVMQMRTWTMFSTKF